MTRLARWIGDNASGEVMDWSFIDNASIIATALVSAVTILIVVVAALIIGFRSFAGICLSAVVAVPIVLAGSKALGVSAAPLIRAEYHDFDADLERLPVVSKLIEHHPDMRLRLTRIMKISMRGIVDPVEAQLAAQEVIEEYLAPYFARTSDIAMSIFWGTHETMVAHFESVDPDTCRAYVNGYSPMPIHLLPEGFIDQLQQETEQVITHAVATPQEEPAREWVENTLKDMFGAEAEIDDPFVAFSEMSCREYLKLVRDAEKKFERMVYFRLLRGLISIAYRREIRDA